MKTLILTPPRSALRLELNALRDPSVAALRSTNLQWTQFHVGLFLDYYGMPHIPSYLTPLVIFIDMAHKVAALPGNNGEEIVSFTYTQDLGKFVVKSLELGEWEESYGCYSENTSFKRVLELAEEARGMYPSSNPIFSHSLFSFPHHTSSRGIILIHVSQAQNSQSHSTRWRNSHATRSQKCPRTLTCTRTSPNRFS
jgi:hypothetical protein